MEQMKEVKLPSGAILKVGIAPFADSKELFQAVLAEMKSLDFDLRKEADQATIVKLLKDLFCTGFSSKRVEAAFWVCFGRCLYNGHRGTDEVFEPVSARQDFVEACMEVTRENIAPFMKSLYAESQQYSQMILRNQA